MEPEDRKKITKSLKGKSMKLTLSDYVCLFVVCLLSIVDNIKLVTEVIIKELAKQELTFDKNRDQTSQLNEGRQTGSTQACLRRALNPLHSDMLAAEAALYLPSDLGMGKVYLETDALLLKETLDGTGIDLSCLVLWRTA